MESVFQRELFLVAFSNFPVYSNSWMHFPYLTSNIYLTATKIGDAPLLLHQFKIFLMMDAKNRQICIKTIIPIQWLQGPIWFIDRPWLIVWFPIGKTREQMDAPGSDYVLFSFNRLYLRPVGVNLYAFHSLVSATFAFHFTLKAAQ